LQPRAHLPPPKVGGDEFGKLEQTVPGCGIPKWHQKDNLDRKSLSGHGPESWHRSLLTKPLLSIAEISMCRPALLS
jgi:hypothetical protein